MAGPVRDGYVDGCSLGPQRFGNRSHADICNQHDVDWWRNRNLHNKFRADWLWSVRIIERHTTNGLWVIPAILYALLGFVFLNTLGWWFWWRKR